MLFKTFFIKLKPKLLSISDEPTDEGGTYIMKVGHSELEEQLCYFKRDYEISTNHYIRKKKYHKEKICLK